LTAGTYFVTVSDGEDCTSVSNIEITQPSSAIETGITVIDQPNCGNQDGELSAFAFGGTPNYTYLWNNETTNPVLTNIPSGIYSITITDSNNCTSVSSVTLTDNDGVTLAANDVENNMCFGDTEGTATISASGGTGMYSYAWSNGGMNSTEVNLPAGNYTITVSDESNCTGEISIEITEPEAFQANEIVTHITCNGEETGSIVLDATGGTGDLTYSWNTGDTGNQIIDLIPGIFSVIIMDANGCSEEIEFVISEPDLIATGDIESESPSCAGEMDGMISINPLGGTGSLSILWSTGDTTQTISNIAAGDFSVVITDENNCEVNYNFTLDDALEITIDQSSVSLSCNDSEDGAAPSVGSAVADPSFSPLLDSFVDVILGSILGGVITNTSTVDVHSFSSVTVTEYKPPAKLSIIVVVSPVFHKIS
jgi:hypothetical protein